jgi:pyruvate kinase
MNFEDKPVAVAISNAAFEVVKSLSVDLIVTLSKNDTMPRLLARFSLNTPIAALVKDAPAKLQLTMTKGVIGYEFGKSFADRDDAVNAIKEYLLENKIAKKNDKILIIGKYQAEGEKATNYPNIFEFVQLS